MVFKLGFKVCFNFLFKYKTNVSINKHDSNIFDTMYNINDEIH